MELRNIEIKARITEYTQTLKNVISLCGKPQSTENQIDTFFNSPIGRLKLRETSNNSALIYYDRPDSCEPIQSDIAISFIDEPKTLKSVLSKSNGIRGIVEKERKLFKFEQTRIHLDEVNGLGKFIELEVVLSPNQTEIDGKTIAIDLMAKFGIRKSDLIDVAYIDLLETNSY